MSHTKYMPYEMMDEKEYQKKIGDMMVKFILTKWMKKTKDFDGEEEDYEKYGASFCTYGIKHALFEKNLMKNCRANNILPKSLDEFHNSFKCVSDKNRRQLSK